MVVNQLRGEIGSAMLSEIFEPFACCQLTEGIQRVGGIHCIYDEEVLASRVPLGAR